MNTLPDQSSALLREVARLYTRAQRVVADCCRTTNTQCHLLTELARSGPLPLSELGTRMPSQFTEDAMHLAVTQWQAMPSTPAADEERSVVEAGVARQVAPQAISTQRFEGAGMHRHQPEPIGCLVEVEEYSVI